MFLTADRELYSWGSNEFGQIGISKKYSQKKIEFFTFQRDDIVDAKAPKTQQVSPNGSDDENEEDVESILNKEQPMSSLYAQSKLQEGEFKPMVQVVKTCTKNFMGVPVKLDSILGKVENIDCGDYNSFSIVKI